MEKYRGKSVWENWWSQSLNDANDDSNSVFIPC